MWPCCQLFRYSVFLFLTMIAGIVAASESQSNRNVDDSDKIKPIMFDEDETYPVTSDVDSKRNRYPFVGEEWRLSQSDGNSFSLDLQINSSTSNASSIPAKVDAVWPYFYTGCVWLPINHISFQFAHVFLCLSYLAPPGLYGLIYLRLVLAIGSALLAAWACFIICALDTFIWNSLFLIVNAVHAIVLIISLRTVGLQFGPQMEQVYADIFKPLKVSKRQFKAVAKCVTNIRLMKRGEWFSVEKETKVETLSILLSGRMLVSQNDKMLHFIHPMQFLDSSDWFQVSSDDMFQVSIRACEESQVLLWHSDKLRAILQKDAFLRSVLHEILGRDVVRKHCQVREKIASSSGNPLFETNLVNNVLFVESESKSLNLSSALNPKNVKKMDTNSRNVRKLFQKQRELANNQHAISNPMNTH